MNIVPIPIFNDNYVWMLRDQQNAFIVDPGDAAPVIAQLQAEALTLREIWITHHHPDHIAGLPVLLAHFPEVRVRAPHDSPLPQVDFRQHDNDSFALSSNKHVDVQVLFVPGHTPDHIAYFVKGEDGKTALFCGDTLFGGGCGRLFGGTAAQLNHSLKRIAKLPKDTQIYCAHEYTESNLRFALAVDPSNEALKKRSKNVQNLRLNNHPTVPLNLQEELATNPFLRVESPDVCRAVLNHFLKKDTYPDDIFKDLRLWKDTF